MPADDHPGSVFGHIPNIPVGRWWQKRKQCCADYVHPTIIAGIYGRKDTGARSVVLKGDSEFADEDHGERFTYIGSGGRAPSVTFGPQTEDQSFNNNRNAALRKSALLGKPVRVVRGAGHPIYGPYDGYRYDGLYKVTRPRLETAPSGFKVCKFDFERLPGQDPLPIDRGPNDKSDTTPDPESLFTSHEEIEEELTPVLPQLAQLSYNGSSSTQKRARRELLLIIGRRITSVLQRKQEEDQDMEYWKHELWAFVAEHTPNGKSGRFTPEQYEDLYNKYERLSEESSSEHYPIPA